MEKYYSVAIETLIEHVENKQITSLDTVLKILKTIKETATKA